MLGIHHLDIAQPRAGAIQATVEHRVGARIVVDRHQRIAAARHDDGGLAAQLGGVQHLVDAGAHGVALGARGHAALGQVEAGHRIEARHQRVLAQRVVQAQVGHARGGRHGKLPGLGPAHRVVVDHRGGRAVGRAIGRGKALGQRSPRGGHHVARGIGGRKAGAAQVGIHAKPAIGHGVHGRQDGAVAQRVVGVVHAVVVARPAVQAQLAQRIGGAVGRGGADDQALGGQAGAACLGTRRHGGEAYVVEDGCLGQRRIGGQRRAGLVDVAVGGVLGQRAARVGHGRIAHGNGVALARGHLGHGFGGHHAVDQAVRIQLGRAQHGRAAVGGRARQHQRVVLAEGHGVLRGAIAGIEHVQRIAGRGQRVVAPVLFRVLLGMRVLDGNAVGKRRVVGGARRIGQPCGKEGQAAGIRARGARAVQLVDGVVAQVVQAHALARVGQRHGAALLQAPLARRADGAIHAARARGRAQHDAGPVAVKAVRHLHGHHGLLAARAVVQHGQVLAPGDQPFARSHLPVCRDVGAVQRAVAAARRGVQDAPVVGVQRIAPQLRRRGIGRVRVQGRGCGAQARLAQAARQQVLRGCRGTRAGSRGRIHRGAQLGKALGQVVAGLTLAAAAGRQRGRRQRREGPAPGGCRNRRHHLFTLQHAHLLVVVL